MSFPAKKNHSSAAKLHIEVMKEPKHRVWQQLGLDPPYWQHISPNPDLLQSQTETNEIKQLQQKYVPENGLRYIISYGLTHCRYAAETQSMFDDIWIEALEVVLS